MVACNRLRSVGPRGGGGGAAAPRVRPHPGRPTSRPPSPGQFLGGPGPCPHRCLAQIWLLDGLLLGSFALFCFTLSDLCLLFYFPVVFDMSLAKQVLSNTSGTRLIVKAYVSKDCLFLPFWTLIGYRI